MNVPQPEPRILSATNASAISSRFVITGRKRGRACELRIFDKGSKERVVQIPGSVWSHIEDYLINVCGYDDGALIVRFWNKRSTPTPIINARGMDVSFISCQLDNVRRRAHELLDEEGSV